MARTGRFNAGEHGGSSYPRREVSLLPLVAVLFLALGCVAALAQVPVQDAKREGKETSIARCVAKSQQLKQQEMSPQKGVKGSVASPGGVASLPASQMTGRGYAPLVGGGASSIPSGVQSMPGMPSVTASGSTAAAVLSSVSKGGQGNLLGLGMGLVGAAGSSLNGGQAALSANSGLFQGLSGEIGTANGTQNGWDQNSQARVSNAQTWNQAVGLSSITSQLWSQRLIGQTAGASAAAAVTTYDPARAVFVPGAVSTPSPVNSVTLTPPPSPSSSTGQGGAQLVPGVCLNGSSTAAETACDVPPIPTQNQAPPAAASTSNSN
jgi:hypothetical protein